VSKGTLYLYFPSKEELFKAVVRQTLSAEIAEGAKVLDNHVGSASRLLVDVLTEWWLRVYESPGSGVFKLVITEMQNFPELAKFYVDEVIEPGTSLIARLIQRGIEAGEFRPLDVVSAVHSVVMPMIMLCMHKHSLGACGQGGPLQQDPQKFIHQHLMLLLNGMRRHDLPPLSDAPDLSTRRDAA
jgi:AcrR family transcriptional regulator